MMIRSTTLVFALAAVLGAGTGAHAQMRPGAAGAAGMMADCPMMAMGAGGPEAILGHADELGLNPDQIARLDSLRDEAAGTRAFLTRRMADLHREVEAVATGETFDESLAADVFGRMGELHGRIALSAARARLEASPVLTPAQRQQLEGLSSHHGSRMSGDGGMAAMHRMMERCPMMGGSAEAGASDPPQGSGGDR